MHGFPLTLTLSRWEREVSASPGPHDSEYLFDRSLEMVGGAPSPSTERGVRPGARP